MRISNFLIVLIIIILGFFPNFVSAKDYAEDYGSKTKEEEIWQQQYDELLNASGANELFSILPQESQDLLLENGIEKINQESFMSISFFDLMQSIFQSTLGKIKMPISVFLTSTAIILLCCLLNSMKSDGINSTYNGIFSTVSVICIGGAVITPIANLILRCGETIKQASEFLLSFIPIYSSVLVASGKPLSGAAYQVALITVVQVISRISTTVFVPLLSIYLAFCLIGSISNEIDITGIAKGIKTVIIVSLSFLLTVFVGLLTLQGTIANSADTLSLKTAKFAVATFLPVVGSAVAEALNSVGGCVSLIKTTVGGFGIFAIAAVFLPTIIALSLLRLSLMASGFVSSIFKTSHITRLFEATGAMLSLLLGLIVVFSLLVLVSIGVMLSICS